MKENRLKSILIKMAILLFGIYAVYIFFTQQASLDSYASSQEYYQGKIENEKEYKESLIELKNNFNSLEYIEQIAREKLDMYASNETIYVDTKN